MNKSDYWQRYIEDWKASSLSKTEYCRQHDIALHDFFYWMKRLSSTPSPTKLIPIITPSRNNSMACIRIGQRISIEVESGSVVDILLSLNERGLLDAKTQ